MGKLAIKSLKSIIVKKKAKPKKPSGVKAYTLKQETFCQTWVDSKGNGTVAALMAFDIKGKEIMDQEKPNKYIEIEVRSGKKKIKKMIENPEFDIYIKEIRRVENVASTLANVYMRKDEIRKRIDEILEEREFTDEGVKREHFKLIKRAEPNVKVRAIDMYYKLKQKYSDTTINISIEEAMKQNVEKRHQMEKENKE